MLALGSSQSAGHSGSGNNKIVQPFKKTQYTLPQELRSRSPTSALTSPTPLPIIVRSQEPVINLAASIFGQKISSCIPETTTSYKTKADFGFHGQVQQVIAGPGQYGNNLGIRVIPIQTHQYITERVTETHGTFTTSDFPASIIARKEMLTFFSPPITFNAIASNRLGIGILLRSPSIQFQGGSHTFFNLIDNDQLKQLSRELTTQQWKEFVDYSILEGNLAATVSDERGNITQILIVEGTLQKLAKATYLSGIATIKLHENVTHKADNFELVNYDLFAIDAKFSKMSFEDFKKIRQQIETLKNQ